MSQGKSSNNSQIVDEMLNYAALQLSKSSNPKLTLESAIVELINSLPVPFSGTTIQDFKDNSSQYCGKISAIISQKLPSGGLIPLEGRNKYFVSPFIKTSVSGIGPVFYINKNNNKIYTLLQRRKRDDHLWWFPGGYVDFPAPGVNNLVRDRKLKSIKNSYIRVADFDKIKKIIIDEYYKNIKKYSCWQKAKKEINDPKFLQNLFKKNNLKWPKEVDYNWKSAWIREVKEEMNVDIGKYKKAVILDFKNHSTFFIGAEQDRLTNIDGRFCALLGILDKEPKTIPDYEIQEARWVALEDVIYDKKNKKHIIDGKQLSTYSALFMQEALFELLCYQIKKISKIKNSITGQMVSKFHSPQNLQAYLFEKISKNDAFRMKNLYLFLSWKFGDLDIGNNFYGKSGNDLYYITVNITKFISKNNINNPKFFANLENYILSKRY
jgi:8-oxo-dGTP pyrophosphatase MutT (NUDIX family)